MVHSLDFATLRHAYRNGGLTPTRLAEALAARLDARGDDGVWIVRESAAALRAAAAALERRRGVEGEAALPLYGLPFAVKDNIDVAGVPTTAACPAFARVPADSAPAVEKLLAAGALYVGKTNLDQFATGLVGVRSPYGVPRNPFDAAYIPGGSSSGSAVAVAAGLVAFALGTDTAGSGRVPAAFTNIVGLKPTHGLVGASGVVPACATLDCVSVFALTVADAASVLEAIRGDDGDDPYLRVAPANFAALAAAPQRFAFGVPRPDQLEFFGNADGPGLFAAAAARLEALGGTAVTVDLAPFIDAGGLLYSGPWIAERLAAVEAATGGNLAPLHPVTRQIVESGRAVGGADAFRGLHRLASLRRQSEAVWRAVDLLLLPTAGTIYRIAEIEAEPVRLNANLGRYTNFCNLFDLAALALPAGFLGNGLPFGVTLFAPAFHDGLLAGIGAAYQHVAGLPLGATGAALPPPDAAPAASHPYLPLAVVGAHLSGQPLNGELRALGARLRRATRTAAEYRLYALADGKRPGLVRCPGNGVAIEVEVWDVPAAAVGGFLAGIAAPLGLGTVMLEDGSAVPGFLCEAWAIADARDISAFAGWRAWVARRNG